MDVLLRLSWKAGVQPGANITRSLDVVDVFAASMHAEAVWSTTGAAWGGSAVLEFIDDETALTAGELTLRWTLASPEPRSANATAQPPCVREHLLLVGRDERRCHILVPTVTAHGPLLSRLHCAIVCTVSASGSVVALDVVDLGSLNGTFARQCKLSPHIRSALLCGEERAGDDNALTFGAGSRVSAGEGLLTPPALVCSAFLCARAEALSRERAVRRAATLSRSCESSQHVNPQFDFLPTKDDDRPRSQSRLLTRADGFLDLSNSATHDDDAKSANDGAREDADESGGESGPVVLIKRAHRPLIVSHPTAHGRCAGELKMPQQDVRDADAAAESPVVLDDISGGSMNFPADAAGLEDAQGSQRAHELLAAGDSTLGGQDSVQGSLRLGAFRRPRGALSPKGFEGSRRQQQPMKRARNGKRDPRATIREFLEEFLSPPGAAVVPSGTRMQHTDTSSTAPIKGQLTFATNLATAVSRESSETGCNTPLPLASETTTGRVDGQCWRSEPRVMYPIATMATAPSFPEEDIDVKLSALLFGRNECGEGQTAAGPATGSGKPQKTVAAITGENFSKASATGLGEAVAKRVLLHSSSSLAAATGNSDSAAVTSLGASIASELFAHQLDAITFVRTHLPPPSHASAAAAAASVSVATATPKATRPVAPTTVPRGLLGSTPPHKAMKSEPAHHVREDWFAFDSPPTPGSRQSASQPDRKLVPTSSLARREMLDEAAADGNGDSARWGKHAVVLAHERGMGRRRAACAAALVWWRAGLDPDRPTCPVRFVVVAACERDCAAWQKEWKHICTSIPPQLFRMNVDVDTGVENGSAEENATEVEADKAEPPAVCVLITTSAVIAGASAPVRGDLYFVDPAGVAILERRISKATEARLIITTTASNLVSVHRPPPATATVRKMLLQELKLSLSALRGIAHAADANAGDLPTVCHHSSIVLRHTKLQEELLRALVTAHAGPNGALPVARRAMVAAEAGRLATHPLLVSSSLSSVPAVNPAEHSSPEGGHENTAVPRNTPDASTKMHFLLRLLVICCNAGERVLVVADSPEVLGLTQRLLKLTNLAEPRCFAVCELDASVAERDALFSRFDDPLSQLILLLIPWALVDVAPALKFVKRAIVIDPSSLLRRSAALKLLQSRILHVGRHTTDRIFLTELLTTCPIEHRMRLADRFDNPCVTLSGSVAAMIEASSSPRDNHTVISQQADHVVAATVEGCKHLCVLPPEA